MSQNPFLSNISISEEASQQLKDTIATTDDSKIRETLQNICDKFPEAKKFAALQLLAAKVPNPSSNNNTRYRKIAPPSLHSTFTINSEVTSRHEKCMNCEKFFDVVENADGLCIHHDGDKEVDDESNIWDDHDSEVHGSPEDHMNDPAYEEGFIWSCCEKPVSDRGCVISRHMPEVPGKIGKKRRRS